MVAAESSIDDIAVFDRVVAALARLDVHTDEDR